MDHHLPEGPPYIKPQSAIEREIVEQIVEFGNELTAAGWEIWGEGDDDANYRTYRADWVQALLKRLFPILRSSRTQTPKQRQIKALEDLLARLRNQVNPKV
jgi:hypothetical protein